MWCISGAPVSKTGEAGAIPATRANKMKGTKVYDPMSPTTWGEHKQNKHIIKGIRVNKVIKGKRIMAKVAFDPAAEEAARAAKAALGAEQINDDAHDNLPTKRQPMEVGSMVGEVDGDDIPTVYLNIAYGVGGLADKFNPGSFILDREHLLVEKSKPLNLIILAAASYWKEYLSKEAFAAGAKSRIFQTEQEVLNAGGTTEWIDGNGPSFSKAVRLALLIEKPEGVLCPFFTTDIGGKKWAQAIWNVDKSAYKRKGGKGVGGELFKTCKYVLNSRTELPENKRLLAGYWSVTNVFEVVNGNNVPMPTLKLIGQNSAELIAEIVEKIKI